MYSSFFFENNIKFYFLFFHINQLFKGYTAIINTEKLKDKVKKIVLFLCHVYITTLMRWSSVFTCYMTMISDSIRNHTFPQKPQKVLFYKSSSPLSVFLMLFSVFLKKALIAISNFITQLTNECTLSCPRGNFINHFLKDLLILKLYNNHYILDFLYKR